MLLASLAALVAAAATPAPAAPPRPPAVDCRDAAHRGFDFFVGDWDVSDTKSGMVIAHSRIELVLGGCGVKETYDQSIGPGGVPTDYHGTSYTGLSAIDGRWRQFYLDTGGAALAYIGGLEDGAMVLTASTTTAAGAVIENRMTVRPAEGGTVRQSGAFSQDGGKTWTPGYDYTYRRR